MRLRHDDGGELAQVVSFFEAMATMPISWSLIHLSRGKP